MVARYEDLRRRGANEGAGGLGRALLMGRGMAAWMEAWGHSAPAWDREARDESGKGLERADAPGTQPVLPEGVQGQAVRILAGMAVVVVKREMAT
jgi:hypothetical protein